MDPNAIRIVNTLAKDLDAVNVVHLVRVFGQISKEPRDAKALRGKVFLGFPSDDNDHRSDW
jgi:hypothetical protein